MSLLHRLWDARKPPAPAQQPAPPPRPVSRDLLQAAIDRVKAVSERKGGVVYGDMIERADIFQPPTYAPGVLPKGYSPPKLAMDEAGTQLQVAALNWAGMYGGLWAEGIGFMGYPYLAELSQRSEYRRASEVYAEEMTRKWLKVRATGTDKSKQKKVKELEDAMDRFSIREKFRDAYELDGFMGLGPMQIDLGTNDDAKELAAPLFWTPEKIAKGSFKGLRIVDPLWMAPVDYNTTDPLADHFYEPRHWLILGREVHATRFLMVRSRPLPDILKPAYNFGGLSLSQLIKPYVDNWLRTRQSVSDLINAFSVWVLETNMQALLQPGGGDSAYFGGSQNESGRAELFTLLKTNFGLMMLDKETEAFQNVSTPLGGLDHLQAQTQEHVAAAASLPLIKWTGITPSGLNPSTDDEIRVFYDSVHAKQERVLSPHIRKVLDVLQLDIYGEIDPEISHEWVPLYELDEAGKAAVRKTDTDRDEVLINTGQILPEEARARIANDQEDPYAGLEGDAPGPPDPPAEGGGGEGGDPSETIVKQGAEGRTTGANAADGGAGADDSDPFGLDAEWHEGEHPRGQPENKGEFASGGGEAASSTSEKPLTSAQKSWVTRRLQAQNVEPPKGKQPAKPVEPSTPPKKAAPTKGQQESFGHIKTIEQAIAGKKVEREKTFHREAFKDAGSEMLHAIAAVRPVVLVGYGPGGGNYCNREIISITTDQSVEEQHGAWRHEFGHWIDKAGSAWNEYRSFVAEDARKEEAKELTPERVKVADRAQKKDGATVLEKSALGDFLGSMSTKFGDGHSKSYYSKSAHLRCAEMFANYVQLTYGPRGEVYRGILHSLAPKCCAKFDELIAATPKDKP